jgi:YVTN family beta-propeller protein
MVRIGLVVSVLVGVALAATGAGAGTLLVANKSDHTLSFVSPESGEVLATVSTGNFPHEVAVSPDGGIAVVSNYGDREKAGWTLTVVDVAARTALGTVRLRGHYKPHGLAWLPDGKIAVTAEGSQSLLVVSPLEGKVVRTIATRQRTSHMVAATADGKRAFVANIGSGTVTVVDLVRGAKIKDIETGMGAEGIAISPDGKEVWVSNRTAGTLSVIDASSLEILEEVECKGFPIRVAITPDGKRVLVSAAGTGEVVAFNRKRRKEIARKKYEFEAVEGAEERLFGNRFGRGPVPVGLVIHPDGDRAFVAATQADVVLVIDPSNLEVLETLRAGEEPDGMAYSTLK